jgi:hypothetical protein
MWINERVRSMNLWLDRALLRCDMSHIDVIDTPSIAREDYTMHSLHLNSRGKKKLIQFIPKGCWWSCIRYKHIAVITHG